MININLFEQKKRNILPHILVSILILGLVGVIVYTTGFVNYYSFADDSNTAQIDSQNSEANQIRRIEGIQDQVTQVQNELDQLQGSAFPVVFLSEEIHAVIDNPEEIIESYHFTQDAEIFLSLASISLQDSTEYVNLLRNLPFFSHVDILTIFIVDSENDTYQADIRIEIDELLLREEWQENDS